MSYWWWMIQFNDPGYSQTPTVFRGFPHIPVGKEFRSNAGDPGLIPGLGKSTGKGIGYPLQYTWASLVFQLGKNPPAMRETWVRSLGWGYPLEKGKATQSSILAWRIPWTVHGVTKSGTRLSDFRFHFSVFRVEHRGSQDECPQGTYKVAVWCTMELLNGQDSIGGHWEDGVIHSSPWELGSLPITVSTTLWVFSYWKHHIHSYSFLVLKRQLPFPGRVAQELAKRCRKESSEISPEKVDKNLIAVSHIMHTCVCAKSFGSRLTHCNLRDCSPPGSSVHGLLQATVLVWVTMSSSRGSSWPRDQTHVSYVSCVGRQILYH